MEGTPLLLKGINYGNYIFENDHLVAAKDGKVLFKVPLGKISNSTVVNKNDVCIELQPEDNNDDDVICEMRLYINPKGDKNENNKEEKDEKDEEKDGESIESEEEANKKKKTEKTAADLLNVEIMDKANISQFAGDFIVSFTELPFIVPRGKYSCDLSQTSLRMHGATFNHIIQYKNIQRAFLLPKPDEVHMYFVIGLEKPLRQGNTSYNYLVMQFKKEQRETINVKVTPEQIQELYDGKIKESYDGPLYDTVAKLFKAIIKINIIIPGEFMSSNKQSGVKCSVKASEGHLFFLIKSLIFIPKPAIYIKVDELKGVEFHRVGTGAQKMFDLTLLQKVGNPINFSGIDKKELDIIMDYFTTKKIPCKTVNEGTVGTKYDDPVDDESDDDEKGKDEEDEDSEEDEDFIAQEEDDEDEDEEEDGDFDEEADEDKPKKKK